MPVDGVHFLALLTRVRAARIAAGELSWTGKPYKRLYDVRAFKTPWAEYAYIYRLAAGGRCGGTAVTSMPQLVRGLAAHCHPSWQLTDDPFVDRDRYHSAVRGRLRELQAMGLLRWRAGVDDDGEDVRTELELCVVPQVTSEELTTAAVHLARWEARHGPMLNTGSTTGVRDAPVLAAPLSAAQRAQRAIARSKARSAKGRLREANDNCAPPCRASTTSKNSPLMNSPNAHEDPQPLRTRTGVTRARASDNRRVSAAATVATTEAPRGEAPADLGGAASANTAVDLKGVAARLAARESVVQLICQRATERTAETACWTLDRGWPAGRVREAWVTVRHGVRWAAESGSLGAGPLSAEDLARLRRAAARYERHTALRPDGFPERGLAALLHIGLVAAEREARPYLAAYGVRALDQLSRRMRALATASDPERLDTITARARRRRSRTPGPLVFRRRWPGWLQLDDAGDPVLAAGELKVREGIAPTSGSGEYQRVLRDAHLLAGLWPPVDVDGRAQMAREHLQASGGPAGAGARAWPGPYAAPPGRCAGTDVAADVLELAQRTGLPLRDAQAVGAAVRVGMLEQLRAEDVAETAELHRRIAEACAPHAAPGHAENSPPSTGTGA